MKAESSRNRSAELVILALYAAAICFLATRHEMWRDEVRALTIVTVSPDLTTLFRHLHNEGHPSLWYLLLWAGYSVFSSALILPAAALAAAVAAAALWLRCAPFSLGVRALWLVGFLPLYEYSVMARNYGIGMLAFFGFLAMYPKRFERPLLAALLLGLAAHSNATAWMLAVSSAISLGFELIFLRREIVCRRCGELASAALLFCAAATLAALQMIPDEQSIVTNGAPRTLSATTAAFIDSFVSHGATFHDGFSIPIPLLVPTGMIALYVLLLRSPAAVVLLCSMVVGMELFHRQVYPALALRHQGALVLAVVGALWIDRLAFPEATARRRLLDIGLCGVLVLQVYLGSKSVREDIRYALSAAPALGEMIRSRPELHGSVIIGEPDFVLDTLPYYLSNPMYFPRQGRTGRYVSFTSERIPAASLSSMLQSAESLVQAGQESILILLPPELTPDARFDMLYGTNFVVDRSGLERLRSQAQLLATFDGSTKDENYSVWEFKQ